jgi:hypothetical protein
MTTILGWLWVSLYYSYSFFMTCYFTLLCFFSMFFLVTSILFFLPSFFQFNDVLFDFWVLGGSRDTQWVELFIISWSEFTPEKPTQSKPASDQTIIRPNRSSKWTKVGWDIETVGCFGWIIFYPNSTPVHPYLGVLTLSNLI